MKAIVLKALDASRAHWRRHERGKAREGEGITNTDCALCGLFCNKNRTCKGCPVMATTGKEGCDDTPWLDAAFNFGSAHFHVTAKRMRKFLDSLVPKDAARIRRSAAYKKARLP